jgi:hypothetical protein
MATPTLDHSQRLHWTVAQSCPVTGVYIGTPGNSATCGFWPTPAATQAQITAGQNALNAYDWSDANLKTWQAQQNRTQAANDVSGGSDVYEAVRAMGLAIGLRLNELLAALKAAGVLTTFTPGSITACPTTPYTKSLGESDAGALINAGQADS